MKFYFRAQDISVSLPGADIAGKVRKPYATPRPRVCQSPK